MNRHEEWSREELQVGQIRPLRSYKVLELNDNAGLDVDYSVTFRITEACDLKCNYCHWHSGSHYAHDAVLTTIDKLFEFFQKEQFKAVLFYYHGGEPTRYSKIVEVLSYIKQKSAETGITAYNEMQTNLTLPEARLREILPLCDQFNVSYHYLELKTKNKLKHFERNWEILKELGVELHNFDVMLENIPEENLDEFYTTIIEYLKYDKIVNSEMIYGFCHYKYPATTAQKHIQFYKRHNKTEQKYEIDGEVYTTNHLFKKGVDARGWKCAAGQESITINGDGNVFNCGINMTNYLRGMTDDKPYTNLVTDPLAVTKLSILYKTGTICRWDYCGGDFYLSREPK